jgi:hypothetical protein
MDPDILVGIFIGLIIWFLVRYLCAQGGKGPSTHQRLQPEEADPPATSIIRRAIPLRCPHTTRSHYQG